MNRDGFVLNSISDRFHSSTALLFGCKGGPGPEAFPRLRNRYSNQAPTILQNRVVRKKFERIFLLDRDLTNDKRVDQIVKNFTFLCA